MPTIGIIIPMMPTKTCGFLICYFKNCVIEESFLDTYVYQPWWNLCARIVPKWMSPNAVTLLGVVFIWTHGVVEMIYNPTMLKPNEAPSFVFFMVGILHFLGSPCVSWIARLRPARKTMTLGSYDMVVRAVSNILFTPSAYCW